MGGGAKSYNGEKAGHSVDHSRLSGPYRTEGNSNNREDLERLLYSEEGGGRWKIGLEE